MLVVKVAMGPTQVQGQDKEASPLNGESDKEFVIINNLPQNGRG